MWVGLMGGAGWAGLRVARQEARHLLRLNTWRDPRGNRGPTGGTVEKASGHRLPFPSSRGRSCLWCSEGLSQPEIRLWHPGGTWYQALLTAPLSQRWPPLEHCSESILITSPQGRDPVAAPVTGGQCGQGQALTAGPHGTLLWGFGCGIGTQKSSRSLTV